MHLTWTTIIEALLLSLALSMDAFISSFAYGSNKIKIPMASIHTINIVCSSILGIALFLGSIVKHYIPQEATVFFCFLTLFVLGVIKLLDTATKTFIKKHNHFNKQIKFSMFHLKFILNLYANPEDADLDHSKEISPMESISLAIALSLDGLGVGFGAALGNTNALAVFLCSLLITFFAVLFGSFLGNKAASKIPVDISWISGALLIILAILKL